MRWSVGLEAESDRVFSREEIVALADAVAASQGVATGIGTTRYGAQLVVEAGSREEAIARATEAFRAAVSAGRPPHLPPRARRSAQRGRGHHGHHGLMDIMDAE